MAYIKLPKLAGKISINLTVGSHQLVPAHSSTSLSLFLYIIIEEHSVLSRYQSFFICSWIGHLSCSQFWSIMNKSAINNYVQVYVKDRCFQFPSVVPGSGITGSCDKCLFIIISNFILNCQTVFQNDYTILHSYQ